MSSLLLEKRVGDGREDDVSVPARITAAFEMIESEFVFELLILLFDGPSLMRDPDEPLQRGGCWFERPREPVNDTPLELWAPGARRSSDS